MNSMDIWAIVFLDRCIYMSDTESAWSSKEKAIEYLESHGAKEIAPRLWQWTSPEDTGSHTFEFTLSQREIDVPGLIGDTDYEKEETEGDLPSS